MPRVLLVYVNYSSFVRADYATLSSFANVDQYQFKPGKGLFHTGVQLCRQLLFLLLFGYRYDTIFIWFSDFHALLPSLFARLTRKKSYVVLGGYDVSTLEEYHYGAFSSPIRGYFTRKTFRLVNCCLPVAESLGKKLQEIVPGVCSVTLATSFDADLFKFTNYQREKRVLTVSTTDTYQRFMVKGLDRFRELALACPSFEFVLIGIGEEVRKLFEPIPENLLLIESQPFEQLYRFYGESSFYAQLSRSEGLPNALCESMLCGCIPLVTDVGDCKITVGDCGLAQETFQPSEMARFIEQSHDTHTLRDASRKRIQTLYDKSVRNRVLRSLIVN